MQAPRNDGRDINSDISTCINATTSTTRTTTTTISIANTYSLLLLLLLLYYYHYYYYHYYYYYCYYYYYYYHYHYHYHYRAESWEANKYKETRCCDAHPSPCHSFHTDFRVTLLFIFSFGMLTLARCGASDAELTQLLWNTAGVKSSLILRHKGPKYGVHLDSDGWASISRGGRMR